MVEPKFALFQMQQKGMLGHARKLVEATFSEAPERLNAVDVSGPLYELVVAVVDAVVPVEAHIYQPVIAAPTVGVDHRSRVNFAPNEALQRLFRAIRYNFRVHLAPAFEQAENDGFAARPAAPFAPHPAWPKVGFVEFERPARLAPDRVGAGGDAKAGTRR